MKTVAALALVLLTACSDQQVNLGGNYVVSGLIPPIENPDIDVLFVVDDSVSMMDNQLQVAGEAKEALFDVIAAAVGRMAEPAHRRDQLGHGYAQRGDRRLELQR